MAHESFEDEQTAAIMNEHLVSIKVDREERPDVDSVYMTATQAMTGQGGWPMTVFMTPDREPFFCGTYFPQAQFQRLVLGVARAWREDREQVASQASQIAAALTEQAGPAGAAPVTGAETPGQRGDTELRRAALRPSRSRRPRSRTLRGRGLRAGQGVRREPRRLRRRAEVPAVDGAGVPAPALRAGRRPGRLAARSRWPRPRRTRWPAAACTTSWPAASPGTAWTRTGSCRTSRRCSTTTRCSPGSTRTCGGGPAARWRAGSPRRPATG